MWCDLADSGLESWSYWSYKAFDDITTQNPATETLYNPDGSLQVDKLSALSRTYAQAIAGVPSSISMAYNTTSYAFTLSYTINTALPPASQVTTIYLNEDLHYPRGFRAVVTPPSAATVNQTERNYLSIMHAAGASGALSVQITAL